MLLSLLLLSLMSLLLPVILANHGDISVVVVSVVVVSVVVVSVVFVVVVVVVSVVNAVIVSCVVVFGVMVVVVSIVDSVVVSCVVVTSGYSPLSCHLPLGNLNRCIYLCFTHSCNTWLPWKVYIGIISIFLGPYVSYPATLFGSPTLSDSISTLRVLLLIPSKDMPCF